MSETRHCMCLMVPVLLVCAFIGGGCSTYDRSYAFTPGVIDDKVVLKDAQPNGVVRTLASVGGVRRGDSDEQEPAAIEVRFRIENDSSVEAVIKPGSLRAVPASLELLDPAIIAEGNTVAPPNSSTMFVAWFPFPEGKSASDYDLSGLNVSWTISIAGENTSQSASFTQQRPVYRYYHSYPYSYHYGSYRYYGYWRHYR